MAHTRNIPGPKDAPRAARNLSSRESRLASRRVTAAMYEMLDVRQFLSANTFATFSPTYTTPFSYQSGAVSQPDIQARPRHLLTPS